MTDPLLELLRCPETRQRLVVADDDRLADFNAAIDDGELRDEGGHVVHQPVDGALIREDDAVMYPVRHGVPMMQIETRVVL